MLAAAVHSNVEILLLLYFLVSLYIVGVAPLFCDCQRHTKDVFTLFFIGTSNIFYTATISCNPFFSQANAVIKISE